MFDQQRSIFDEIATDRRAPAADASFDNAVRHHLSDGAWIEFAPRWLVADGLLFDDLVDSLDWSQPEQRMYDRNVVTPRLVARCDASAHPAIQHLSELLSDRYGRRLDRIGANWYRDGNDSVAWHGDRIARDLPSATVATVSLRGPRDFRYQPAGGGTSRRLSLGHGDLVVMGGSFQRTWRHSIPKTTRPVPPRMVVMFRHAYD
jgi:alkylated DNA repair dioxygenase AlkB